MDTNTRQQAIVIAAVIFAARDLAALTTDRDLRSPRTTTHRSRRRHLQSSIHLSKPSPACKTGAAVLRPYGSEREERDPSAALGMTRKYGGATPLALSCWPRNHDR